MKRDLALKKLCECTKPADVVIFGSSSMASEAHEFYKPGHFYIKDYHGLALSVALGIASGTDKRVFVFMGEGDVLRNFGVLNQIAASKQQNIFIIILNNGCYQSAGGFPNIFNNALSMNSLIFNIGCKIFNLTSDLEKKRYTIVRHFFDRGQGPMVVIVRVEKGKEYNTEAQNNLDEFLTFVRDSSIKSALYNPFVEGLFLSDLQDNNVPILKV